MPGVLRYYWYYSADAGENYDVSIQSYNIKGGLIL